ncbi:MAG: histidine kinase [Ferruginibacter sp.]|nr:histidine kinase [Ferruginibacter sp.]
MFFLQVTDTLMGNKMMIVGSTVMLLLAVVIIVFATMHQRKIIRYHKEMQRLEEEKQEIYLKASIRFQEEERSRIAADLHDDAGPLLATVRLYLNENLVNQDKAQQTQSIYSAKQIIDEAIQLIRNISHSLMPPTLKNFGLESATTDLFQKINGSGVIKASARFHDYRERLVSDREMLAFRVVQEIINNIIKHSHAGFIHLTQNVSENNLYIRIHHDGKGIIQAEYDKLSYLGNGLGLKNIASRMKVLNSKIMFEIDSSHTYYKVTLEIPKEGVV